MLPRDSLRRLMLPRDSLRRLMQLHDSLCRLALLRDPLHTNSMVQTHSKVALFAEAKDPCEMLRRVQEIKQ